MTALALVGFSLIHQFTKFAMLGAEWVMWLLIVLSVLSVALMLERAVLYRKMEDDLDKLAEDVRDLLRAQDIEGTKARLARSPSPAAMVALAGINDADRGAESAEEAMAGATARVRMVLERNLAFLATVGNNAPFVGLFGTVIGIIQAFDALKAQQAAAATAAAAGGPAAAQAAAGMDAAGRVMGTIAEALVATAIGLLVAIPAVAAFNFFSRKVKSILTSGDTISHVVLAHLKAKDGHVAAPAPAKKSEPKSEPKHENVKKGEKGEKSEKSDKTEQSESKKSESSESKKD
ncbi:MAG: MotA/TolQ/ExbB proton channel family protein [Polyangiales bacterium]